MKRFAALLLLAVAAAALGHAEVPVRTESLVWTALAFNGRDYSPVFAPESSDTLYLLEGVDNFLSLRKTLIYWWPMSSSWKTDTESLNVQFPGTMEVQGRGGTQTVPVTPYTYFNMRGEYELNWKVATGDDATRELAKYSALYDSYFKAVQDYQARAAAHDEEMRSLGARIQKLRDEHRDFHALLERMKNLAEPVAPVAPTYYVVPPAELQEAFIVNLPAGRYEIRLKDPEGRLMEGSEKTVVVHGPRRSGAVGYDIIPSDKWTRPVESDTPSAILYVNGTANLYLRAFFEDEFNDLFYAKTVNNGASGNANIERWIRIQQVPHATVKMEVGAGGATVVSESSFTVRQSERNSLGYSIVPWIKKTADDAPDLIAFPVPLGASTRAVRLQAYDSRGAPLAGSQREIRVVRPLPSIWLLIVIALSPLAAMAAVLVLRARSYSAEIVRGD